MQTSMTGSTNGLQNLPELHFEEEKHQYYLNGMNLPSVTTIMRPLSSALYKDIDPEVLDKAATKGTIVHNAIENYVLYGIEDIDPDYGMYFQAFMDWYDENEPKVLATEYGVYHKALRYAGMADMIAVVNGKKTLIDFKTSVNVNKMLTGVQLEAYAKALESLGQPVDQKAILHLRKDGKYSYIVYEKNDLESWTVFGALLTVHNHIQKYKWRKSNG